MKNALITGVLLLLALFVGAYTVKGQKSEASRCAILPFRYRDRQQRTTHARPRKANVSLRHIW